MTENLNWQELHDLIRQMILKTETQKSVSRTISRINYSELINILTNNETLKHDRTLYFRVTVDGDKIKLFMKRWGKK